EAVNLLSSTQFPMFYAAAEAGLGEAEALEANSTDALQHLDEGAKLLAGQDPKLAAAEAKWAALGVAPGTGAAAQAREEGRELLALLKDHPALAAMVRPIAAPEEGKESNGKGLEEVCRAAEAGSFVGNAAAAALSLAVREVREGRPGEAAVW